MKIEKQVCSLELAKRLKELGAEQKSLFKFQRIRAVEKHCSNYSLMNSTSNPISRYIKDFYSAYTVAELGEMLPQWFETRVQKGDCKEKCPFHYPRSRYAKFHLEIEKIPEYDKEGIYQWSVWYKPQDIQYWEKLQIDTVHHWIVYNEKKLADAMTKMLIHLIENNLFNPDNQNQNE